MPISFKCPECQAVLKSANPLPAGKQVKCPKCTKMFTTSAVEPDPTAVQTERPAPGPARAARVPKPAAPKPAPRPPAPDLAETSEYEAVEDDYEAVEDEHEAVEDEYEAVADEEPAPKAKKHAARADEPEEDEPRPRKKKVRAAEEDEESFEDDEEDRPLKKKKGRRHPAALVYSLVIFGFSLVFMSFAGTLYFILADISGGSDDMLTYLPANSNFVAGANFESLWSSKLGAQARAAMNQAQNVDLSKTGLKPDEFLHEMVVGGHLPLSGARMPQLRSGVAVFKTKVAFDHDKFVSGLGGYQKKELNGKSYYQKGNEAIFLPSNQLVVLIQNVRNSDLESILSAKRPSLSSDVRSLIGKVRANSIWLVMPIDEDTRKQIRQNAGAAPPDMKPIADSLGNASAVTLTVNLDSATVKVGLGMAVGGSAGQLATDLEAAWKKNQNMIALGLLSAPPMLSDVAKELVQNVKFGSDGNLARISTEVKMATLEKMADKVPGMQ